MRKQTILLALALIILNVISTQAQKAELEVQQIVIKVFDALSDRDATALRNLCTADARFNEYGETWSVDTLVHKAITTNTEADFKRSNKLDFLSTTIKGDVAWTTYNLHSTVTVKDKIIEVYWMETVIAVFEQKKWKLKVLHSTRVK